MGSGSAARRRPGHRHGAPPVPCSQGSGTRNEPDRRRRSGPLPDRGGRRAQGHHRSTESGRCAQRWTPGRTLATRSSPVPRAPPSPRSTKTTSAPTTLGALRNRRGSCGTTPSRTRYCVTCCRRLRHRPKSSQGRHDDLVPWSNNEYLDELLPNSEIHPLDAGRFACGRSRRGIRPLHRGLDQRRVSTRRNG